MSMQKLEPAMVMAALDALPGWGATPDGVAIVSERTFADFDAAMVFINQVADIARRLDHHPDLYNVYNRVRLLVTTHDAGGLTSLDLAFAREVVALQQAST